MTSMMLLMLIITIGGLFLTVTLSNFIRDHNNDLQWRQWAFRYYGSSVRAIYTLFEVTLAGCWPTYFRPLIEKISPWYAIFVTTYISVVFFAIIRIITALFLKDTLNVAQSDKEMQINDRQKQTEAYCKKLGAIFKALDTSGDGTLDYEKFQAIIDNNRVRIWMQILDLEVHDCHALFRLLNDGSDRVTYEEFIQGVLRLKGQARSLDIIEIMRSSEQCLKEVRSLEGQVTSLQYRYSRLSGELPAVYPSTVISV
jgi:Ca2+-binding EF-hand superfamily protein